MGIADRHYVRRTPPGGRGVGIGGVRRWSVNTWLILTNITVFIFQAILPQSYVLVLRDGMMAMDAIEVYGHFSTSAFFGLEVWRLVTFQFIHGGGDHLIFNMLGLWLFGGMVEDYLKPRRYLAFYLTCGIFGGLAYLLLNLLGQLQLNMPGVLFGDPATPLIGASAGVFGVLMACAYIAPNSIVQLIFPPIPLRLKVMVYGYVLFAAINLLAGGHNAGGDAAHLGGALAGFFFVRRAHLLHDFFDVFTNSNRQAGRPGDQKALDREVDRILAKVADQGMQSLTDAEKSTLRRASQEQRRTG